MSRSSSPASVTWSDIAGRFTDDKQCLASFLALNTAEVLSGEKPANLINIPNRPRSCGKNLYDLWKTFGPELVEASGLSLLILRDSPESLLVYVYDNIHLRRILAHPGATAILRRHSYAAPNDVDAALSHLQERMRVEGFPHEIGIFLGYPLKDVVGFMGLARLDFSCQAGWRIYGDPKSSLELANRFRSSRNRMASRLSRCTDPLECLVRAA